MAKRGLLPDPIPLYPDEETIALLVLGPERAHLWPSIAGHDEAKHGLPKIDPVHGGRYWPAVQRFYDLLNGLDDRTAGAGLPVTPRRVRIIDTAPHGQEDFAGEKAAARRGARGRKS